jgi:hypothetical protein
MANEIQTACELIDRLGGTAAVARLTRRSAQAVSNWRSRGLPAEAFLVFQQALADIGEECPHSAFGLICPSPKEAAE